MKKIFAAVFSMALVFGLVGCGAQSTNTSTAGQQVQGATDEESVAKARELMEALIDAPASPNRTEVDSVSTIVDSEGEDYVNTVTTTVMKDTTGDVARFMIKTVSDPSNGTDATYYIEGTNGVMEVEDERGEVTFDQSYIDSLTDPADTSDSYRVYYDCAETIQYYESESGLETVSITVDPTKLMENGLLSESFTNIESCVAEYTFDTDGNLTEFINTIKGDMVNEESGVTPGTIEIKCLFTDYGTTVVPALPEVNTDAVTQQQTDEAQSGE